MNYKKHLTLLTIISLLIININTYPFSATIKAEKDYRLTLNVLRKLRTMVENFPNEKNNTHYNKVKSQFQDASEEFYGRNFTSSVLKYRTLKTELIVLLERIAADYLKRTKSILDSTSKDSINVIIDFGKGSSFAEYFKQPFDPLYGIKPYTDKYTSKDHHFFRDKETIERYLKEGYRCYHFSKGLFEDPEIVMLKNRKKMTSKNQNYIINRYLNVVRFCRQAKKYGIEIHKINKVHDYGDILRKYNLSNEKMTPIFDDRIPKEYKADAIDNLNLLYSVEQQKLTKKTQSK